ncbi:glycosyltransferase family 8 protein [Ramaria rubella]|nr:glycosyltransferase family 8 protein [Ramaria rubella]
MKGTFATLLTRDSYLAGTLVLNHALRSVGSKYELVVMATPELSQGARETLSNAAIKVRDILRLSPKAGHTLAAHDGRFEDTWTKLRWDSFFKYNRVALLDSDMLVLQNMDDLLEIDLPGRDWIAACHACACNPRKLAHYPSDWIPENCAYTPLKVIDDIVPSAVEVTSASRRTYALLNSGTVLLQPSDALANDLYHFLATSPLVSTFSFPDQDLLAHFFKGRWKPLPYVYNSLKTLRVIHTPLWRDKDVRCLHYILTDKPWMQPRGTGGDYETVNGWWWDRYEELEKNFGQSHPGSWALVQAQVTKT